MALVVDTSAVVCIAIGEADAEAYVVALSAASTKLLPAPAYLECAMVLSGRLGVASTARLAEVLTTAAITIEPFTQEMAQIAIDAFHAYGKGRHKASLNFGDCFVYGAAKALNLPLLYKGNDFAHTDIASALA
jgi:ribonuclease VapC